MSDSGRLAALRAGDEDAYRELVAELEPLLLRLARTVTASTAVAEEVVQETWVAVLRNLDGFRGDSSLRTWVCTILVNTARRRAAREARSVPLSSISGDEAPPVDPDRFFSSGPNAGHWSAPPQPWRTAPETAALSHEVRDLALSAIAALEPQQQSVITLRDVEGMTGPEVASVLGITPGHQRVLLHRARNRVRAALEDYFAGRNARAPA